jgi:tetratricopeptide (TPR) repeat protein
MADSGLSAPTQCCPDCGVDYNEWIAQPGGTTVGCPHCGSVFAPSATAVVLPEPVAASAGATFITVVAGPAQGSDCDSPARPDGATAEVECDFVTRAAAPPAPDTDPVAPQDQADPYETRQESGTDPYLTRGEVESDPFVTRQEAVDPHATRFTGATEDGAEDITGVRLRGLKVLGVLGRGGMGVVYKAQHLTLQRLVAVKMILGGSHAGPQERARVRTEAEAIARLQHPNIVQIYDIGEQAGLPYLTLEFCPGGSLAATIDRALPEPREAARLVEKLARAMHYAHERHIIHRDLKPANVLLSADGEPKITDFGLAKKLDAAGQTQTGAVMGTPCYMAPEQAQGLLPALGPCTDVYALGAILYELLVGRPPFRAASAAETFWQVQYQDPLPPRQVQPQVARDLETICLKCLQKEIRKRYSSAAALADDLRRFLAGEAITARSTGALERAVKWARRRPLAAASVVLSVMTLVSLCAVGVFYGLYQDQQRALAEQQLQQEIDAKERYRLQFDVSHQALASGKALFEHADWPNARAELVRALALIGAEPQLIALKQEAGQLLEATTARLAEQGKKKEFKELRDQALFHWSQVTGLEREANRRTIRAQAARALELFGAWPQAGAPALDDTKFTAPEKAEITAGCYEMLFVLADATAQALPGEDAAAQADLGLRLLEATRRLRPPALAYHLGRADCLGRLGEAARPQRAEALALAARLAADDALDHFLCGLQKYQARDPFGAVGHFDQTLRRQPGHFWANFLTGVAYLDAQQWARAQASLTACLAQNTDFFWAYVLRGYALGELAAGALPERQAEAKAAFQSAEEDFRRAEALRGAHPEGEYVFLVNRAVLRLRQQQAAAAVPDFEQAIRLRPRQYQTYLNLAEAHLKLGQPERARARLDEVLVLEPKLAAAYRARARIAALATQPDLDGALRDLEAACACPAPSRGDIVQLAGDHTERGIILLKLGRAAQALAAFGAALALQSDYVALRLKAETLLELDRNAEALTCWDSYLKEAQLSLAKFLQAREPVADVYLAQAAARARLKQFPAALEDCHRAVELQPSAKAYVFRGSLYVQLDTPQLALPNFDKAIALEPANADALGGRGWCRVQQRQTREGLADVDQAVRLTRGSNEQSDEGKRRILYGAACTYAQALAQSQARSPAGDRAAVEAQELLVRRALGLLQEAVTQMPTVGERRKFWREVVELDRALVSLRGQAGFERLQEFAFRTSP